jgi:hypothetical protein
MNGNMMSESQDRLKKGNVVITSVDLWKRLILVSVNQDEFSEILMSPIE